MVPVDLILQPDIEPAFSFSTDRYLMHAIRRRARAHAALRIYSFKGDVVGLGRYHLAPEVTNAESVQLFRRICGGRALPLGEGFVGISLILPHRSALFGDDPFLLNPAQVLNRYVRGILEALRALQLPAYYPGRDFITLNRRAVGAVSFESDEHGVLLFEAVIANTRPFSLLATLLDAVDHDGVIKAEVLTPDSTTSLALELGKRPSFPELADLLRQGYAKQFSIALEPHDLSPLEVQAVEAAKAHDGFSEHLGQRRARPDLDRHAVMWAQLGAFEIYFALEQDRFIKEALFAGDFIANSAAVETLERRLRLVPLDWNAINDVAEAIFSERENFILGIGKLRTIADMIMREAG